MIPKFRAWDKVKNEMYVVEQINFNRGEFESIGYGVSSLRGADKIKLMQSTGLKDKNGKEIFEGDIVDYKGREAVVKWHGSYASFIYRFVDELKERVSEWDPLYLAYLKCEVIGNIYENPELLEVEE